MLIKSPLLSLSVFLMAGVFIGVGLDNTLVSALSSALYFEKLTAALLIALPFGLLAGYLKRA